MGQFKNFFSELKDEATIMDTIGHARYFGICDNVDEIHFIARSMTEDRVLHASSIHEFRNALLEYAYRYSDSNGASHNFRDSDDEMSSDHQALPDAVNTVFEAAHWIEMSNIFSEYHPVAGFAGLRDLLNADYPPVVLNCALSVLSDKVRSIFNDKARSIPIDDFHREYRDIGEFLDSLIISLREFLENFSPNHDEWEGVEAVLALDDDMMNTMLADGIRREMEKRTPHAET